MENKFKEFWIKETNKTQPDWEIAYPYSKERCLHVVEYAALQACEAKLESANAEISRLEDDLYSTHKQQGKDVDELLETVLDLNDCKFENAKLRADLEYYKEMELRYEQLLEETSNEAWVNMQNRVVELTAALNRIGMLAMSEHAYTSEFTEKARNIVQGVLK